MSESPQSQSPPPEPTGDISITSGQLMCALQLGIFLPILGPLLLLGLGAMNSRHRDGKLMIWGGLGLILLQGATLLLIYGYYVSHRMVDLTQ